MTIRGKRGLLSGAAALVALFVLASSASAVTLTPAGTKFTATAQTISTSFGGVSFTCDMTITGTTANPATNSFSFSPVFTGCANSLGIGTTSISISTKTPGSPTTCDWTITFSSTTSGVLTIKETDGTTSCFEVTLTSALVSCDLHIGNASIPFTFSNSTTSLQLDTPNTVPYTRTGSGLCPASGNATIESTVAKGNATTFVPTSLSVT